MVRGKPSASLCRSFTSATAASSCKTKSKRCLIPRCAPAISRRLRVRFEIFFGPFLRRGVGFAAGDDSVSTRTFRRTARHGKQWVARQITRARRRARSRVSAHGEPPASPGYLRRASEGLACAHPGDRVDSLFVGGLPVQPTVGPLLCKATVKAD
jgi:hypothetical protein